MTYRVCTEYVLHGRPLSVNINLLCWLGDERGKCEPVEVRVLLDVGEGDDKEAVEEGRRVVDVDALPDAFSYRVE